MSKKKIVWIVSLVVVGVMALSLVLVHLWSSDPVKEDLEDYYTTMVRDYYPLQEKVVEVINLFKESDAQLSREFLCTDLARSRPL